MHALGIWHEMNRFDRNEQLWINYKNINSVSRILHIFENV